MKLHATVPPHFESIYWQLHKEFHGNQNRILNALLESTMILEGVLRADAADRAERTAMSESDASELSDATDAETPSGSSSSDQEMSGTVSTESVPDKV